MFSMGPTNMEYLIQYQVELSAMKENRRDERRQSQGGTSLVTLLLL